MVYHGKLNIVLSNASYIVFKLKRGDQFKPDLGSPLPLEFFHFPYVTMHPQFNQTEIFWMKQS